MRFIRAIWEEACLISNEPVDSLHICVGQIIDSKIADIFMPFHNNFCGSWPYSKSWKKRHDITSYNDHIEFTEAIFTYSIHINKNWNRIEWEIFFYVKWPYITVKSILLTLYKIFEYLVKAIWGWFNNYALTSRMATHCVCRKHEDSLPWEGIVSFYFWYQI